MDACILILPKSNVALSVAMLLFLRGFPLDRQHQSVPAPKKILNECPQRASRQGIRADVARLEEAIEGSLAHISAFKQLVAHTQRA
jgi:hypothetical protein